jgi:DNA-binding XRE family transcriptional regulator
MGIFNMPSQILRPVKKGENKNQAKWLIQGSWGKMLFTPMSKSDFHRHIREQLIKDGVLPYDTPYSSIKHHQHITLELMKCSFVEGRWVKDESFASRLKGLREVSKLTQEQLADKAGLDLGTVRQLEQGTRTNPQWQTVCCLAKGLEKDVRVFTGTEGYVPPETNDN